MSSPDREHRLVVGSDSSNETAESGRIVVSDVSKKHGDTEVLQGVSFTAEPARVTAFLGPNGAGKSSTLRILLGLDRASSGTALFDGRRYADLRDPLREVGAVFDGVGGARTRRVRTHLAILADSNGLPRARVAEVLELVDLKHKARARLGNLSLGEGQRTGLAAALLGDPRFLVLDEPTNGLDPGGIRWFRRFVREQADGGKTVLLSSHMLPEVEAVADDLIFISKGRIALTGPLGKAKEQLASLEELFFAVTSE
jgi:ABC-2 type transport system ATP-binding protein